MTEYSHPAAAAQQRLEGFLGPAVLKALSDPGVNEIMLNPDGRLYFDEKGTVTCRGTLDRGLAEAAVRTMASLRGCELDPLRPVVSGTLPLDGSRFEGLLPPLCDGPSFSIRRHTASALTLADLEKQGVLDGEQRLCLSDCLKERRSIIICGPTGSGKTTFLNALLKELAQQEPRCRVISLEDTRELSLPFDNKLALLTTERADLSVLLRSSLRLNPDRIIIGEIRGAEALDLVDALTTGHEGGMATLHAGSVQQALKRFCLLVSRHKSAPRFIEPTVAQALDVIVVLSPAPARAVREIACVRGCAAGEFVLETLC